MTKDQAIALSVSLSAFLAPAFIVDIHHVDAGDYVVTIDADLKKEESK